MKHLLLLTILLLPFGLFAQQQFEDVVYLNNGSVYRGVIIEQVPGVSLKIQIMGGSIVAVAMNDVAKLTKETPFGDVTTAPPMKDEPAERVKTPFTPRLKGYFFQGQLLLEAGQLGMRVVNGYKFGRFGHVGIGVGVDGAVGSPFNRVLNDLDMGSMAGAYFPLYVYYAGDILNSRVTPFYAIEAGYAALGPQTGLYADDYYEYGGYSYQTSQVVSGGAMGSVGIGVRFNTRRRVNFSLLLNANFKNMTYEENFYLYDDIDGIYESYGTRKNATLLMMGMRFGIGF